MWSNAEPLGQEWGHWMKGLVQELQSGGVEKGRWRSKAFGTEGGRDNWNVGGGGTPPEMNERKGGVRTA